MPRSDRLEGLRAHARSRAQARASPGKAVLHGLIGWGILLAAILAIVVTRTELALAGRAALPPMSVRVPAATARAWKSIPPYHDTVPVLTYHGIGGRNSYLTVSRTLFAQQMAALKLAGFHTLTLRQYVSYVRGDTERLPSRPILLTFDDGRLDAYRAASDILRANGFHGVDVVVPGWVTSNPNFSVNWSEINQMTRSGTWDIAEHFGYGSEGIRIDQAGRTGGTFGDLQYYPGNGNQSGHLETFSNFQQRFTQNMLSGELQLQQHVPGYQSLATAIPKSDYGQVYTNDLAIPGYVISWLDRHFPVVFGGDYIDTVPNRPYEFQRRKHRRSRQVSFRITMGPQEILPVLRCRLLDWINNKPIWYEYSCLRLAKSAPAPEIPRRKSTTTARVTGVAFNSKPLTKGRIARAAATRSAPLADAPPGVVLRVASSTAVGLAAWAWRALRATKPRSSPMSSSTGAHWISKNGVARAARGIRHRR